MKTTKKTTKTIKPTTTETTQETPTTTPEETTPTPTPLIENIETQLPPPIDIYINKKTINTTRKTHLEEFTLTIPQGMDIKTFTTLHRTNLINIKDTLLNRENLTKEQKLEKLNTIKESIKNNTLNPLTFFRPIGIRTDNDTNKSLTRFLEKEIKEKESRLTTTTTNQN